MNQQLKLLALILVMIWGLLCYRPQGVQAQLVSHLATRVSRLEAENFQLRSRLNRLERQLGHIDRVPPSVSPTLDPTNRSLGTTDSMFDRLATLVIELKERVQTLETAVAGLK